MPTTSGTIKGFTRSAGAFAFTITSLNPSPPPPEIDTIFDDVPEWVRDSIIPNVGKTCDVVTTGTPPTISSVTVRA